MRFPLAHINCFFPGAVWSEECAWSLRECGETNLLTFRLNKIEVEATDGSSSKQERVAFTLSGGDSV